MSVWKSDETLLSICILNFSFKNDFVWEEISNIRHSVSSPDETPRSSSKILRCESYFQLSSRCFIWWWNTASHVWYITSQILEEEKTSFTFEINVLKIFEVYHTMKAKTSLQLEFIPYILVCTNSWFVINPWWMKIKQCIV